MDESVVEGGRVRARCRRQRVTRVDEWPVVRRRPGKAFKLAKVTTGENESHGGRGRKERTWPAR